MCLAGMWWKVAWGPPFLFWDSSEKVFPWAMLGGTEMGPWTKCSDFQPTICESKWGWGWGKGEKMGEDGAWRSDLETCGQWISSLRGGRLGAGWRVQQNIRDLVGCGKLV